MNCPYFGIDETPTFLETIIPHFTTQGFSPVISQIFAVMPVLDLIAGSLFLILFLAFSGLISASEVAFFSLNASQIEEIEASKKMAYRKAIRLLEKPDYLLATILIANNFINVSIVLVSAYLINLLVNVSAFPVLAFILQVIAVTAVILLFGEILPKIYSTYRNETIVRIMAAPLYSLYWVFRPLSTILVKSTGIIDKRIKRMKEGISLDDISEAIDITEPNQETTEETRMYKGIVRFGNIQVREIMVPRVDIVAVNNNLRYHDLIQTILSSGYSRIPVYSGTPDTVVGLLYIKDLLNHLDQGEDYTWQKHLRPAYFIPENKKIDSLLKEFQNNKIHMAIVVDEYGGTSGIVTLEDVLEEIIGDINDEFDTETEETLYSRIDDQTYLFDGKTLLNDFTRILSLKEDYFQDTEGEFDTLAGLILEIEGRMPEKNEIIFFKGLEFRIDSVDKRRIKKIRVVIRFTENEAD